MDMNRKVKEFLFPMLFDQKSQLTDKFQCSFFLLP